MKNILIISSKKYTKLKTYTELLELLKVMEINYNTVYIEDSDEDYGKHLTPETLIVSFGGDGTALKAMKTSWSNDLLFMPLGTGRVGYLVNQSGDIHDVLKSWINEDNEIVKIYAKHYFYSKY